MSFIILDNRSSTTFSLNSYYMLLYTVNTNLTFLSNYVYVYDIYTFTCTSNNMAIM